MPTRTVEWADPSRFMREAGSKRGLDLLREWSGGPPPPIAALMGFRLVGVDEGKAVFEGETGEHLYNPIGVVHGGFAMTLLDSAMGVAVHTTVGAGERYTSIETKVNFVRAITLDTGLVRAEGVVIHRGGTIATAEGRLTSVQSGKLLAHGTSTCLIIPARSA